MLHDTKKPHGCAVSTRDVVSVSTSRFRDGLEMHQRLVSVSGFNVSCPSLGSTTCWSTVARLIIFMELKKSAHDGITWKTLSRNFTASTVERLTRRTEDGTGVLRTTVINTRHLTVLGRLFCLPYDGA